MEIESFTVPDTIQGVIRARIDRLEEGVKHVLQCASVIGRLFRPRLLAYTTEQERRLDEFLWKLEESDLIYEERAIPELEYSFKHVLTQETAYQSLLARRRAAFHRKVAEGIETLYREQIEAFYEALAYHYDETGDVEKTVEYLLLAGEKARKAYLNEEAIGYFQRALELLDASPTLGETRKEWRLAALKGLGRIYYGIGKLAEAEESLRSAIALSREMGVEPRQVVRLYAWLGEVLWWQARYDELIRLGREGLALLGDETESVEAVLMKDDIAVGFTMKAEREKSREFAHQNASLIMRLPYSEELRSAYSHIFTMYVENGKNVEAASNWLDIFEQSARQHHHLAALAGVSVHRGNLLRGTGDAGGAISMVQKTVGLYGKIGDAKHEVHCLTPMAGSALSLGELQKAEACVSRMIELGAYIDAKRVIAQSYQTLGGLSLCHGNWEEAIGAFQTAIRIAPEESGISAPLSLGRAYLAQGKHQEALSQFQEALSFAKYIVLSYLQKLCL